MAHTYVYAYSHDRTLARLGMAKGAIDRAFAEFPELPEAHLAMANYHYLGLRDFDAALAEFAVAEHHMPENADVLFGRAMVYRRLGQWERAVADLEQALRVDPRNPTLLREAHLTEVFVRDYSRAHELLDRSLGIAPDDGTGYVYQVLLALRGHGNTELARRYEGTMPSANYDHGLAHTYAHWLAAILDHDYERALRLLDRSDEQPIFDGDVAPSFVPKDSLYARTHVLARNDAQARRYFETVMRKIDEDLMHLPANDAAGAAVLYLSLAEAQAGLGQRAEALATVARARSLVPKTEDEILGGHIQLASVVRVLAPAGDTDPALLELADYLRGPGLWAIEGLKRDPRLDPIRDDPRFDALLENYERK
jgi:tetratricopeptide (TPR) repeat protein